VTKTTNIAIQTSNNLLGVTVTLRSLAGVIRSFSFSSFFLSQRG
jgi:hypothetical protein